MSEIFVTGHRTPDTDSIVAAISYAALRNALDESLAGTRFAKDRAAKCLTTIMIPEALDYPM